MNGPKVLVEAAWGRRHLRLYPLPQTSSSTPKKNENVTPNWIPPNVCLAKSNSDYICSEKHLNPHPHTHAHIHTHTHIHTHIHNVNWLLFYNDNNLHCIYTNTTCLQWSQFTCTCGLFIDGFIESYKYHLAYTLRKDFVILQLYWWLFSSTKYCSWNMI